MGDADWVGVVGKLGSGRVGWYVYCTYLVISKVAIAWIGPDSRRNSQYISCGRVVDTFRPTTCSVQLWPAARIDGVRYRD